MFFDGRIFGRYGFKLFAHGSAGSFRDVFMQAGASWRCMLVCQPPVMRLGTWLRETGQRRSLPFSGPDDPAAFWDETLPWEEEEERVARPELGLPGLRMGTLYDRVIGLFCKNAFSIALYWDIERDFAPREEQNREEGFYPDETSWRLEEYVNVHNGREDWEDWIDHPETIQLLSNAVRNVDAVIMVQRPASCNMGGRANVYKGFEERYKFSARKVET